MGVGVLGEMEDRVRVGGKVIYSCPPSRPITLSVVFIFTESRRGGPSLDPEASQAVSSLRSTPPRCMSSNSMSPSRLTPVDPPGTPQGQRNGCVLTVGFL